MKKAFANDDAQIRGFSMQMSTYNMFDNCMRKKTHVQKYIKCTNANKYKNTQTKFAMKKTKMTKTASTNDDKHVSGVAARIFW